MSNAVRPQAPPSLEARASMINGTVDLPKSSQDAKTRIKALLGKTAFELIEILNSASEFDYGTATRSIQSLQNAKKLAREALKLPFSCKQIAANPGNK